MSYAFMTDTGLARSKNQDAVYATDDRIGILPNLYVVADGMGGHKAGEYASTYALDQIKIVASNANGSGPVQVLNQAITTANAAVYGKATQDADKVGMGTTVVAATIDGNQLTVANVGDSRLYLCRDRRLEQITVDHSIVEEMVNNGQLSRNLAKDHPKRNFITRAVGAEPQVRVDFFEEDLKANDLILLCSDGLTTMVDENDIAEIITRDVALDKRVEELVTRANANGGMDNITVILIDPYR
ncbi:MAG: Stp1/IreP family PP2C-type Ser/Thr phosphatase [Lachnospiraceae bacterium]|nr:Stp1/IreP family PP2C-type Ser/Thr phosphatase [Lachnospiraceae bacterium]